MDKLAKKLPKSGLKDLNELTKPIAERHRALEFAGFLIREDEDAVYIADVQGTWVIPRDSVTSMFDWDAGRCVPPYLAAAGRAVRVGVADGSTIQEIRPWKIVDGKDDSFHRGMRQLAESIFTLGGQQPITDRSIAGERQLAELEQAFSRRLGWNPSRDPCNDPVASGGSHTIVVKDGYCDVDEGF